MRVTILCAIFVIAIPALADTPCPPATHTTVTRTYSWIAYKQQLIAASMEIRKCPDQPDDKLHACVKQVFDGVTGMALPTMAEAFRKLDRKWQEIHDAYPNSFVDCGNVWTSGNGGWVTALPDNCKTTSKADCLQRLDNLAAVMETANSYEACLDAGFDKARNDDADAKQKARCDQQTAAQKKRDDEAKQRAAEQAKKAQHDADDQARRKAANDKAAADAEARRERELQHRRDVAEQFQRDRAVAVTENQQAWQNITTQMEGMRAIAGGNHPAGSSWYAGFAIGIGFEALPLFTSFMDKSGRQPDTGHASTMTVGMHGELWPQFGSHWGIGAVADGTLGGFITDGGTSSAFGGYLGVTGFVGRDSGKSLLFDAGWGTWSLSTSSSIVDPFTSDIATSGGNGSLDYSRLGVGIRSCLHGDDDPRFCTEGIDVKIHRDATDIASGIGFSANYWGRRSIELGLDFSFGYPTAGTPSMGQDAAAQGFALGFNLRYRVDHWTKPREGTTVIEVARDERWQAERKAFDLQRCDPRATAKQSGEEDLVAYWSGDCYPSTTELLDVGFEPGREGTALSFGEGDSIVVPDAPDLDSRAFTVSAWVKPAANNRVVLLRSGVWALSIDHQGYAYATEERADGQQGFFWQKSPMPLPRDRWTHIALSYDGVAVWLYIDGSRIPGGGVANVAATTQPLYIGGRGEASDEGFHQFQGGLDELKLYRRALTSSEIAMASLGEHDPVRAFAGEWRHPNGSIVSLAWHGNEIWGVDNHGGIVSGVVEHGVVRALYRLGDGPYTQRWDISLERSGMTFGIRVAWSALNGAGSGTSDLSLWTDRDKDPEAQQMYQLLLQEMTQPGTFDRPLAASLPHE